MYCFSDSSHLHMTLLIFVIFLQQMQHCFREGNGNPPQYCCLENPMGGGAWQRPWGRTKSDTTEVTQQQQQHTLLTLGIQENKAKKFDNNVGRCQLMPTGRKKNRLLPNSRDFHNKHTFQAHKYNQMYGRSCMSLTVL